MSHLRYAPHTPSRRHSPTTGQGKHVFASGGSSLVNKSRAPLRPCGRGRRTKYPKSTPPPRQIPLPFLKFPAEVRNKIYAYLLTFENDLVLMDHKHAHNVRNYGKSYVGAKRNNLKGTFEWSYDDEGNSILVESDLIPSFKKSDLSFIDQSILLVNKQIYDEARGVLLANNTLKVTLIDLNSMKPARWETMRHFTRFNVGMYEEAMPTVVSLLCSTHYDLLDLEITMVIPGAGRTRCQYWVKQMMDMLGPLRDLCVRGQVTFGWVERHLVDNPEVRRETVKWLEKLGMDMMGGPGNGDEIVIGEEMDKLSAEAFAARHASTMAAAIAASSATTPPPAPVLAPAISTTVSPTPAVAAPIVSTPPATRRRLLNQPCH
ncbi:hypothetical protein E2P81_ATG11218 [Venturia nashicola]|uniref:Uncharacterized protein n=1 Tax=Venturia nashicola TaxID=86259 RepID=A0A4Z1P664_9PEZI|nr:hypothetical protein E6O75_ATG10903 [Venturia nashicola]TLD35099.1 hypothetical protein E2P81_ATG11218 [Venturia nashicola]